MQEWMWGAIVVLACGGLGLAVLRAWWLRARERSRAAWERMVQRRFPEDRPRMRGGPNEDARRE